MIYLKCLNMKLVFVLVSTILMTITIVLPAKSKSLTGDEIKQVFVSNQLIIKGIPSYYINGKMCWREAQGNIMVRKWEVRGNAYISNVVCTGKGCALSKFGNRITFRKLDTGGTRTFTLKKGHKRGCF